MIKKIIVFGTIAFLLFEVLYFNSNVAIHEMENQVDKEKVYKLAVEDHKEDFLNQYQDIVLEDKENTLVVLTNSKVIEEIQEKYHIIVEK